ncbi:UDP-N-acetylmuramoyl-tripeptide--D-alanyl-D-alanine ligase [uncultured Devosia sp.]|uniref:UDP-N-acetylmuramoyl-tripeptide--D-alanyl-D- alanine ligase n=1 Tax=uncultured Devosia sp. TaxID=211434 RepID=UPI0035CABE16
MPALYTLDAVLAATGGRAEGVTAESLDSITIDSREIGPDALFVAIKGDRFDGHDFVDQALANGALAALVSRGEGAGRIVVADPLEGLRNLAVAARARSRANIVGVTGSVGKTTTKEMIRAVLAAAAQTHASIKSFNNHWGVPLMLARLPQDAQFGVFEMGMNHAGEIAPLSRVVRPHIAVITTIAPAHLETLGSLEAIAGAKAEIFAGLEPGGTVVLNADHDQIGLLREYAAAAGVENVVTYGFAPGSDWQIVKHDAMGDKSSAEIRHDGQNYQLLLKVPGRHMVANAVAALAVGFIAGVDPSVALRALAGFGAQPGRGQKLVFGNEDRPLVVIDESYNANTASMVAALDVFANQTASGRKVLVLGDMLELGAQGPQLHASLAEAVNASCAERIYLVGPQMAALADALGPGRITAHTQSAAEMAPIVVGTLAYGDAVMIKASNGIGLADVVEHIRKRFA